MSTTAQLRAVVVGLIAFAAAEEEMLLASAASDIADPGDERRWAAVPTVAHNTEFKAQQAERITAVLTGCAPPAFGEIDHRSPAVYGRHAARAAVAVVGESRQVTASLLDGVGALGDDDLVDPSRHPWLNGRPLWLQIAVRGFWHPTGHVADYYLGHGRPGRAVDAAAAHARHDPLSGRPGPGSGHGRVQSGLRSGRRREYRGRRPDAGGSDRAQP